MRTELAEGRKFKTYSQLMDAALEDKLKDILPHTKPGFVVDAGFGTGKLLYALTKTLPKSHFAGVDLSDHYVSGAKKFFAGDERVKIYKGDISGRHFPDNSIDTKIFSTVIHEVYSYNNYDLKMVEKTFLNTLEELKRGGRLVIRDGIKPESGKIEMDITDVTNFETFIKFSDEFKNGRGIKYAFRGNLIELDRQDAYEFLSKKEFLENWDIEVNEEFGYLTLEEYKKMLVGLGYRIVTAKSFQNPWIVNHWWRGHVEMIGEGYPATNCLIVAEKF